MGLLSNRTQQLGRQAHHSDWLDHVARAGLVAFGVVHLVVGWLAVQLALGDSEGSASSSGAIRQLAEQPFGKILVWLVTIGMFLLALWQVLDAVLGHRQEDGMKRVRKRLASAGRAVVYVVIGISALRIAIGSGSSGGSTDSMTAQLMDLPGGQVLVALVGLGVGAVGVALGYKGLSGQFLEDIKGRGQSGHAGTAYTWLGRIGYTAKAIAFLVVGGLFCYAAATHEPDKSGGLDQALREVLDQPYGPVLLTLLGVGIGCFGLFCFAWARHVDR